jgi:hypothetical protein
MACALASLKFFRRQAIREHPVLQHRTFATLQKIRKLGSNQPFAASATNVRKGPRLYGNRSFW